MVVEPRLICTSEALADGGDGVRFEIEMSGVATPAFVIRYRGRPYAYLNRCAHVPAELDWIPGKFFDLDAGLIVCATHGAAYDPISGHCVGGPCRGARLRALQVVERDGAIWLVGAA